MREINPERDGVNHINIYSQGKTRLGKALSNFSYYKFTCEDGQFISIEGYWYWLSCKDPEREILRSLWGYDAKRKGRELRGQDWNESEDFKTKILAALKCKLDQNQEVQTLLKDSELPFEHYYVFGTIPSSYKIQDESDKCKWMINFWEEQRNILKGIENG